MWNDISHLAFATLQNKGHHLQSTCRYSLNAGEKLGPADSPKAVV